jgi:hypothetical protein
METATTTAIQVDLKGSVGRRANQNGRTAGSFLTAAMRLSYCARFALCAFLLCKPTYAQDRGEFWPEVDTYVNLSSRTRLYFIVALSGDQDTRNVQGEFGPNFDFFLRPFARVYLKDEDPAKSKLLTFRVGYRYLPIISGDDATENRAITELTARFKLPLAILMSDRNRFVPLRLRTGFFLALSQPPQSGTKFFHQEITIYPPRRVLLRQPLRQNQQERIHGRQCVSSHEAYGIRSLLRRSKGQWNFAQFSRPRYRTRSEPLFLGEWVSDYRTTILAGRKMSMTTRAFIG